MKLLRLVALSAILTIATFGVIVYSSCNKTSDPCSGVTCLNGGACSGGTCTCPTGFMGTNCGTYAILGKWNGSDNCTPTNTFSQTISIDSSSSGITNIIINNPDGYGTANNISGTLSTDGKTVTFTNQVVNASSSPDTLTGTFTLTSNSAFTEAVTIREGDTSTHSSTTYSCSGNYTRQ
jgi:hypothetical protein